MIYDWSSAQAMTRQQLTLQTGCAGARNSCRAGVF